MKYYFLALGTLLLVCVGCSLDGAHILDNGAEKGVYTAPPAERLYRPGPMVDGPGPGVMPMLAQPQAGPTMVLSDTQVRFVGPAGMQIGWQIPGGFADNQETAPCRHNFRQGAMYRLKLSRIPGNGREGLTLYPTLQVFPGAPPTAAYLSHDAVPLDVNDEDLDQVQSNNFVTKVIYLPSMKYQELAVAGVETLVSTKLEPGVDPVAEASRRGTILLVFRMGNMDLEMPKSMAAANGPAGINQVAYHLLDGDRKEFEEPLPIAPIEAGVSGVPAAMVVAGAGYPGMPGSPPISGVGGVPVWGYPSTGTPIGLVGPPHLPFGGPASLQSHTVRNLTKTELPRPVDHMLIDVKETPGYSLPAPVKHIEYTEEHPVYREGEVVYPRWALPDEATQQGAAGGQQGGNYPPGQPAPGPAPQGAPPSGPQAMYSQGMMQR